MQQGLFRRDLIDRAPAKIHLPPLYQRQGDISELAQAFVLEAAQTLGKTPFYGLTRRARADVELAFLQSQECSVRRLRELMREVVFGSADSLGEELSSELVLPILERELQFQKSDRAQTESLQLETGFQMLVAKNSLRHLSELHGVREDVLDRMCSAMDAVIDDLSEKQRSYRSIVERSQRLLKIALWVVSRAESQADFRRFFGQRESEMPTKSVAHQVYYEVFPKGAELS